MKKKILLIGGIILLVIAGVVYYLRYQESNKLNVDSKSLNYYITNGNQIGKRSYVETFTTPEIIANFIGDDNAFYVLFDKKHLYLAYLNKKEANMITDEDVRNGYHFYGFTKENPSNIADYGLEFLEHLLEEHKDDEDFKDKEIKKEDFNEYFGTIHLDTTNSYQDLKVYNIIFYVTGILGMIFLLDGIYLLFTEKGR